MFSWGWAIHWPFIKKSEKHNIKSQLSGGDFLEAELLQFGCLAFQSVCVFKKMGIEHGPDCFSQVSLSSALFLAGTGNQSVEWCWVPRCRSSVQLSEFACCNGGWLNSGSEGLVRSPSQVGQAIWDLLGLVEAWVWMRSFWVSACFLISKTWALAAELGPESFSEGEMLNKHILNALTADFLQDFYEKASNMLSLSVRE